MKSVYKSRFSRTTAALSAALLCLSLRADPVTLAYDAQFGAFVDAGVPVSMGQMTLLSTTLSGVSQFRMGPQHSVIAFDVALGERTSIEANYELGIAGEAAAWAIAYIPFALSSAQPFTFSSETNAVFSVELNGLGSFDLPRNGAFSGILNPGAYTFIVCATVDSRRIGSPDIAEGWFDFEIGGAPDISLRSDQVESVPDSAPTALLFGLACAGLGLFRRRHVGA